THSGPLGEARAPRNDKFIACHWLSLAYGRLSSFLSTFRSNLAQTKPLPYPKPPSVSPFLVTLRSFLSSLPPTTPDITFVLLDSGRCELAVRQRFVGRSDPGVAALDRLHPQTRCTSRRRGLRECRDPCD